MAHSEQLVISSQIQLESRSIALIFELPFFPSVDYFDELLVHEVQGRSFTLFLVRVESDQRRCSGVST